jgi:hypothetical protein
MNRYALVAFFAVAVLRMVDADWFRAIATYIKVLKLSAMHWPI